MNGKKRSPPGIKVKYPFDSVPEEWGCTFETWKIFEFNKNFSSQHLTFLLYNTSQKPNLMFSLFWEKKKNFNFLMRIVFIYMLYSHQMLLHIRDEENKTLYIFHSLSLSLSLSRVVVLFPLKFFFCAMQQHSLWTQNFCTSKLSCCFLIYALNDNSGCSIMSFSRE